MANSKATKKALFMSIMSLLLCFTMLMGATFAWFTDTVTSANNKIQAGTLKVDLELLDKETGKFNSIKESKAPVFDYDKWEPGYVDVKVLKIENEGTLALKWFAKFVSEAELSILANVIDVYVCPSETELAYPQDRDLTGYTRVGTAAEFINTIEDTTRGELLAGESAYLGIALKMQESAGNEYQGLTLGEFDIQILATQLTAEQDSFDDQYDVDADFDGQVSTYDALVAAAAKGGTYQLKADIALAESVSIPDGVSLTIDLNGKTINVGENQIENKGNLTLSGGTLIAEEVNDDTYGVPLNNKGTLTVLDGTTISGYCQAVRNEGTMTVEGGTLKATANNGYTARIIYNKAGNLTINDGTFIGCASTNPSEGCSIVAGNGTTVINGGNYSDFSCVPDAIFGYQTNTTVKGGTYAFVPYDGWTYEQSFTKNGYLADGYTVIDNGDGTYTVLKGVAAATTEDIATAITSGETTIALTGSCQMPDGSDSVSLRGKTVTFVGTEGTVLDVSNVDARDQFVTGATLAFEGVTLNFGTANYMGFANCESVSYKDCTINGLQFLYTDNVTFENCDFNSNGAEHCVWTYAAQNVDFIDCDFTYGDRGINCYSDNDVTGGKQTVNFTDCTFTSTNPASEGAVEINSCYFSVGIEVNMEGCMAPAYGEMAYISQWDGTNGAKTTINIK